MKFPRMIYKKGCKPPITKDDYKIVQNEAEHADCMADGYQWHWDQKVVDAKKPVVETPAPEPIVEKSPQQRGAETRARKKQGG